MVFTKRLRDGVRRGRIRCSVRIWQSPRVKAGNRYPMDDGHIVVDSIDPIRMKDVTDELARESGFENVKDLVGVAKHGSGKRVYLIRFHYLPPGGWDTK
ncbi:MAG: ASCH domain-containing protein [Vicinamibacterales bacterium]